MFTQLSWLRNSLAPKFQRKCCDSDVLRCAVMLGAHNPPWVQVMGREEDKFAQWLEDVCDFRAQDTKKLVEPLAEKAAKMVQA